jgi:hypothetical protein
VCRTGARKSWVQHARPPIVSLPRRGEPLDRDDGWRLALRDRWKSNAGRCNRKAGPGAFVGSPVALPVSSPTKGHGQQRPLLTKSQNINWFEDWLTTDASGVRAYRLKASLEIAPTQTGED